MLLQTKQIMARGWCYEGVGVVVAGAEAKQGMREVVEGSSIDNTLVYPNTPQYCIKILQYCVAWCFEKHFGLSKYPQIH